MHYGSKHDEFLESYKQNSIYIPVDTGKKIDQVFGAIRAMARAFDTLERMTEAKGTISEPRAERTQQTERKFEELHETLPKLFDSLLKDVQRILGIPDSQGVWGNGWRISHFTESIGQSDFGHFLGCKEKVLF
jgi:hypothetical protein